jgi:4'-phosphopantetheinyl transferase
VFAEDRRAFVAGRALSRTVLAEAAGVAPRDIAFDANEYGKPRLARPRLDRQLSFNISHTRALVACAVGWDREIGVDVETIRDPPMDLAEHYFAPPEAAALRALSADEQRDAFFAVWTLKEAFIKAIGRGLSQPLDRFAVSWSPPALLPYGDFETGAAEWELRRFPAEHACAIAVCVSARGAPPPRIEIRWAGRLG